MSSDTVRPDPEQILLALKRKESLAHNGKLSIFFGMAAGVGKTFAMLKSAHERKKEGVDVVIGTIDTHGRPETEALVTGMLHVSKKKISYRDSEFEELDVDAVLSRKPRLVLVDELAHTNVPGSRHPKRWQDVLEILDAGIDVYTTLNVQHIESRKELVEDIAGIPIRETVPDSVLERAYQIQLIDLSPAELLQRLREGKVYLGDKAAQAAEHFFKEDRLTALRELALRFTAEKVDHDLSVLTATRSDETAWKTGEVLMVAVSHSPYSEALIRATRRLAFNLEASWIGVYVDTGTYLSFEDRITLARNLNLVRELGGEVITLTDPDLMKAIKTVAAQRKVTQIIVGRPTRRWVRDLLTGGNLLHRLVREAVGIDVHVIRLEHPQKRPPFLQRFPRLEAELSSYVNTFWVTGGVALFGALLSPFVGYRSIGFIFLLAVLITSLVASLGPVLFSALLSALVWDYFFIPPFGTFHISETEDVILCIAYLVTAAVTGALTHRVRLRERILEQREKRTHALYQIVREIADRGSRNLYLPIISERLGELVRGSVGIILKDPTGSLVFQNTDTKEAAVAQWAYDHAKPAGWMTDTLAGASSLYIPLRGTSETVGVLKLSPKPKAVLTPDDQDFLYTVVRQLGMSLEQEILQERAQEITKLKESEKLYQSLLNSVSHELRTPITAILGSISALGSIPKKTNADTRDELLQEISDAADRLNGVVENLLDMARLGSGKFSLQTDWHDPADVIQTTITNLRRILKHRHITTMLESGLPLIQCDFRLVQQALTNVLVNAATYSPQGRAIEVEAKRIENELCIRVLDEGPGVPESDLNKIFEKFYRSPKTSKGGVGLGLAVAKSFVEIHGGRIDAQNRPTNGLQISIYFPVKPSPKIEVEQK